MLSLHWYCVGLNYYFINYKNKKECFDFVRLVYWLYVFSKHAPFFPHSIRNATFENNVGEVEIAQIKVFFELSR